MPSLKTRGVFHQSVEDIFEPIRLHDLELRQSVEWLNWQPYSIYQPNMKNAPVLISHGPNDHWVIAQYRSAEQLLEAYQIKVADAKKRNRKPPAPLGFSLEGFVQEEVTLEGYDEKLVTTPFPNQYQPSEWKAITVSPHLNVLGQVVTTPGTAGIWSTGSTMARRQRRRP